MAETLTVTHARPATYYLHEVDRLGDILDRYSLCNDILSNKLHRWGLGVFDLVAAHPLNSDDALAAIALKQIRILASEILLNPLMSREPLKEPVLERAWTWEASTHADCLELFDAISPLDRGAMSKTPPIHLFAGEMIAWMHQVAPPTQGEAGPASAGAAGSAAEASMQLVTGSMSRAARRSYYMTIAAIVVPNETMREMIDETWGRMDRALSVMRVSDQRVIAAAETRVAAHEAALQGKIDTLKATHEEALSALQQKIDAMTATHQRDMAAIEEQIGSMDAANREARDALSVQLAQMKTAHRERMATLESQLETQLQGHERAVETMRTELTHAIAAQKRSIASLEETHRQEAAGVQDQTALTAEQLKRFQIELKLERLHCEQFQGAMASVNRIVSSQDAEIRHLRDRVERMSGGCVIS